MRLFRSLAIFVMAAGLAASMDAQATSGNIYGSVSDEQGGKLPGVAVSLSGCGAPRSTTTGAQGDFRFLNLAPCTYTVRTELSGFATVERNNVVVNLGTNTELSISMKIASVATTITVTSESPLLDTRKQASGANYNQQELKSIPTGRDPWVILQQTPGVLVDRQNVGGSQERPAGQLRRQGHRPDAERVERRRRDDHRHVRRRLVPDLLRLRRLPGDAGDDRRHRPVGGRPGRHAQHGDQARHERSARVRPRLRHAAPARGLQHAHGLPRAAAGPRRKRHAEPHLQHPGLRRRGGRTALARQGLALGQLRKEPDRPAPGYRHDRQDDARGLRRQVERPADRVELDDGLLFPRRQAEVRTELRPDPAAADFVGPVRSDDDLEGRGLPGLRAEPRRRRLVQLRRRRIRIRPRGRTTSTSTATPSASGTTRTSTIRRTAPSTRSARTSPGSSTRATSATSSSSGSATATST